MIKKYQKFILESKFLKDVHIFGYLEKKYYIGIDSIIESLNPNSYIEDESYLIWDYNNEEVTQKINEFTFRVETQNIFNLDYLKFTREPIEVCDFDFKSFVKERVNHYMIKSNNSDEFIFGELGYSDEIKLFVKMCYDEAKEIGLDTRGRYCFITIDQKIVEPGKTQREFVWHIDGLQGEEVGDKKPADYQFIWADETPTKFCTQTFEVDDIDVKTHNVFKWVGHQVRDSNCYLLDKKKIYLMNSYHVHTATKTDKTIYRKFIRVSFTNTPITSIKMSVNPDISYNYDIHVTSGNIPTHLK